MRKRTLLPAAVLLLGLLAGCGSGGASSSAAASGSAAAAEPLHLSELNVELSRREGAEDALMSALRTLPEELKTALAQYGVEADAVHVTVGTSPSATCQALKDGGVDAAFLSADAFAELGGGRAILADTTAMPGPDSDDPADWTGGYAGIVWSVGTRALLCASDTDYGRNLAQRTADAAELTWDEVSRARWGVLAPDSLAGDRCLQLWLEDSFGGNTVGDLPSVTAYATFGELLQAARNGEIDAFPVSTDLRSDYAEEWPGIWKETHPLALTEYLYSDVAAVTPGREELQSDRFASALSSAVYELCSKDSSLTAAFGVSDYAAVTDSALDGMRRLCAAEG